MREFQQSTASFASPSTPGVHYPWMDLAKGVSIFLVVFGHTTGWYSTNLTGGDQTFWGSFNAIIRPLPIPLFFLISGILAAGKMERPLRESWPNTIGLYLLGCIWTAIFCLKLAVPGGRDGLPYPGLDQLALAFLLPVQFWYIWVLPAYYLIAWTLRRIFGARSAYALVPMALLSLGSWWIGQATSGIVRPPFDPLHSEALTFNLIWFYLGCQGKGLWIDVVENGSLRRGIIAFGLFFALSITATRFDLREPLAVFLAPFALWGALEILGCLHDGHPLVRRLRDVGTQTLPIYVMHMMVLTAMTFVVGKLGLSGAVPYGNLVIQLTLPILIALTLVVICLRTGHVLRGIPVLRYLVRPIPSPFKDYSKRSKNRKTGMNISHGGL